MASQLRKTFKKYDSAYPFEVLNLLLLHAAQKNLTKYEHQVYLVLIRYTLGYKTDSTYIGYGFIAACAGIPNRFNVKRAILGLMDKGMLERKHHYNKPGYTEDRNRYTLIIPEKLVYEIPRFKSPEEIKGVLSTEHRGEGEGVLSTEHAPVLSTDPTPYSVESTLNSIKENNKEIKESGDSQAVPLRGLDRFPEFWTAYPNRHRWERHKAVSKERFEALEPAAQDAAIRALKPYQDTPEAKAGYILRPDNFLSNSELFTALAAGSAGPAAADLSNQIDEWRRAAEADPPRESLMDAWKRQQQQGGQSRG